MPQVQLPVFPNGSVEINVGLACRTEGEQVVYYNGHMPVFTHARNDLASFRLFTAQLIVQGSATQGDIHRAFGVPLVAIKRSTKLYRERSAAGFFAPKVLFRQAVERALEGALAGAAHAAVEWVAAETRRAQLRLREFAGKGGEVALAAHHGAEGGHDDQGEQAAAG